MMIEIIHIEEEAMRLRRFMNLLLSVTILFLLTGCVTIPTGDGDKIKLSKDGLEFQGEDGTKSIIDVDTDKGGQTITTDDGTTSKIGAHAEVPADFPKEILKPEDKFLMMATDLSQDDDDDLKYAVMLGYQLTDDKAANIEKFRTYLEDNGYEVNELQLGPEMHSLQGQKEESFLMYQFMNSDDDGYMLQVMYGVR